MVKRKRYFKKLYMGLFYGRRGTLSCRMLPDHQRLAGLPGHQTIQTHGARGDSPHESSSPPPSRPPPKRSPSPPPSKPPPRRSPSLPAPQPPPKRQRTRSTSQTRSQSAHSGSKAKSAPKKLAYDKTDEKVEATVQAEIKAHFAPKNLRRKCQLILNCKTTL